jgi:hypothetical protein
MAKPKTKLGPAPWPGKPPKPVNVKRPVDLSIVTRCNDPYTAERVVRQHKYDEMFEGVKEGDCFRIDADAVTRSAVARALRLYLKRQGVEGIVRQSGRTDDGIGRVWLVKIVRRPKLEVVA